MGRQPPRVSASAKPVGLSWKSALALERSSPQASSESSPPRLRRRPVLHNRDVNNLHRTKRFVIRGIPSHMRDLLHQLHRSLIALPKDRVAAIQMRHGHFGDEKLRAVGSRSGVGVSETARLVEEQVTRHFVLEFVSWRARAISRGIAALNHEVRNHPMKNCPVIQGHPMLGRPLTGFFQSLVPLASPIKFSTPLGSWS